MCLEVHPFYFTEKWPPATRHSGGRVPATAQLFKMREGDSAARQSTQSNLELYVGEH